LPPLSRADSVLYQICWPVNPKGARECKGRRADKMKSTKFIKNLKVKIINSAFLVIISGPINRTVEVILFKKRPPCSGRVGWLLLVPIVKKWKIKMSDE